VQLIPRSSVIAAGGIVDVPTVDEMTTREETLRAQLYEQYKNALVKFSPPPGLETSRASTYLRRYMDSLIAEQETTVERAIGRLEEVRRNRQLLRSRWGLFLARLSPVTPFTLVSSQLAGTDLGLVHDFRSQAGEYRRQFAAYVERRTAEQERRPASPASDGTAETIDVSDMPEFAYNYRPLSQAAASIVLDVMLLLLYGFLAFIATVVAFARYDLR